MPKCSFLGNVIEVPRATPEMIERCIKYAEENGATTVINGETYYMLMFPNSIADLYTRTQALSRADSQ